MATIFGYRYPDTLGGKTFKGSYGAYDIGYPKILNWGVRWACEAKSSSTDVG